MRDLHLLPAVAWCLIVVLCVGVSASEEERGVDVKVGTSLPERSAFRVENVLQEEAEKLELENDRPSADDSGEEFFRKMVKQMGKNRISKDSCEAYSDDELEAHKAIQISRMQEVIDKSRKKYFSSSKMQMKPDFVKNEHGQLVGVAQSSKLESVEASDVAD